MHALLAALPLVVACVLLAVGAGPMGSAAVAVVTAAILAVIAFPVGVDAAWSTAVELGPTTLEVLVILLGGVVLSEAMARSGAQQVIGDWVRRCCADPGRAVLLVVLGITPFAESLTGFGIGVVIAVPLLRHIGLRPRSAAVVGLLGLVIVPWGALAPGTLVAARLGGVGFDELGVRSAALSGLVFLVAGGAALLFTGGRRALTRSLPDLVVVGGVLWAAVWVANLLLGTPLAGAVGGLAGITAALLLSRLRDRVDIRLDRRTAQALRPYAVLVAGLLVTSLLIRVLGVGGAWTLLGSPALWLVVVCATTPWLLGLHGESLRGAVTTGARRWRPIALATALFLLLGGILTATGMSAALAEAASRLGPAYLALVPVVGGLGGFIAGSNTGANAMFAASQAQAAQALGVSGLQVLGAQNVAASLLTMASPPRVALAVSLAVRPVEGEPDPSAPGSRGASAADGADGADGGPHRGASHVDVDHPRDTAVPQTRQVLRPVLAADAVIVAGLAVLTVLLS